MFCVWSSCRLTIMNDASRKNMMSISGMISIRECFRLMGEGSFMVSSSQRYRKSPRRNFLEVRVAPASRGLLLASRRKLVHARPPTTRSDCRNLVNMQDASFSLLLRHHRPRRIHHHLHIRRRRLQLELQPRHLAVEK